jgi:hypothetical protein
LLEKFRLDRTVGLVGEQKPGRPEGIRAAGRIGIGDQLSRSAAHPTAMTVEAPRRHSIGLHRARSPFSWHRLAERRRRRLARDQAQRHAEWLIEKNGHVSPVRARATRLDTHFRRTA